MNSSLSFFAVKALPAASLALVLASALTINTAAAQQLEQLSLDDTKQVRAVRVQTPPVLDGRLDDPAWARAEPITDFHQIRPGNGTPPSERTEVYLVYDDDALYIGARMYDSNPELIAAPTIRHGQGMPNDDRLVIILDPFNTGRVGYRFETNINAMRHDSLYTDVNTFQIDWSTIWEVATSVDEHGWIAEIAIPFKSLPFDPAIENWGFNFGRGIRRRGEEMAWVSRNRTYNPSISGVATGLSGLDAGLGLDVVPSMTVNQRRRYDPDSSDNTAEPSLDVFYRLTPSLNAALTINTDFSATEVDNRQVNLTRFNLFFPEKRDFFLNDSDLFQFGNIGFSTRLNQAVSRPARENARPYFSRNIGLSATGEPIDIDFGTRISGRVGRWNIGTLLIRQDSLGELDASNLLVTRLSANVLDDSSVGMIFTSGDPQSNLDNRVYGADFQYLNNRLQGGRVLEGEVWFQVSETPGLSGDNAAYGAGLRLPSSAGWRGGLGYKEVQRNFNPAMGYVNRADIRDLALDVGYTRFFDWTMLQTAFVGLDAQRVERLQGGLQSEALKFRLLELEAGSRDRIDFGYTRFTEDVRAPFVIYSSGTRQVIVQPGRYQFGENEMTIRTAGQRRYSGNFTVRQGDFYSGDRLNLSGSLNWNQSRFFKMSVSYDWNSISLTEGDFVTRLTSLATESAFTSTLFWINLLQYDNISNSVGINTRLHWIPRAGQEGFLVLNYNMREAEDSRSFERTASDVSMKFRYTFRF